MWLFWDINLFYVTIRIYFTDSDLLSSCTTLSDYSNIKYETGLQHYSNVSVPLEPDRTTLWSASKVRDINPTKKAGNLWVGFTSPTTRDTSRLVFIWRPTCLGVGMFCTDWSGNYQDKP